MTRRDFFRAGALGAATVPGALRVASAPVALKPMVLEGAVIGLRAHAAGFIVKSRTLVLGCALVGAVERAVGAQLHRRTGHQDHRQHDSVRGPALLGASPEAWAVRKRVVIDVPEERGEQVMCALCGGAIRGLWEHYQDNTEPCWSFRVDGVERVRHQACRL